MLALRHLDHAGTTEATSALKNLPSFKLGLREVSFSSKRRMLLCNIVI